MAIVWPGMPCCICGEPIDDPSKDTLGWPPWFYHGYDPRYRHFNDTACHQSCIDNWHLRDELIAYFNEHNLDYLRIDARGHVFLDVRRYRSQLRKLNRDHAAEAIRQFVYRDGQRLCVDEAVVRKDAPDVHEIACKNFGTWAKALEYAGISKQ